MRLKTFPKFIFTAIAAFLAFFAVFFGALSEGAGADAGEIAVIEDSTGSILPISGICANFMYPNGLCVTAAGSAFFATHPDEYDFLILITNKSLPATEKAGYPLQVDAKGMGVDNFPWHYAHIGSKGRLLHVVTLGSIASMPDDPEGIFTGGIPISGLEIIGHELGHHWLAYTGLQFAGGQKLDVLRGYQEGNGPIIHYSCWFNSYSVLYGGMLTDNKDGTFTDVNGPRKFTQLDQYFMGLRSPQEVEPMWYVEVNSSLYGCADWPRGRGVPHDISGERVDFTIDDIIRANGPRVPATSKCHYKAAFAFVHPVGLPPSQTELAKFELYRSKLEKWWEWATDNRSSLDATLSGCGEGTAACAGQKSPQCGAPADGDADVDAADTTETTETDEQFCTPGARGCDGKLAVKCDANGENWMMVDDCSFNGGDCRNGECAASADGDDDYEFQYEDVLPEYDDSTTDETTEAPQEEETAYAEGDVEWETAEANKKSSGGGCGQGAESALVFIAFAALALRSKKNPSARN